MGVSVITLTMRMHGDPLHSAGRAKYINIKNSRQCLHFCSWQVFDIDPATCLAVSAKTGQVIIIPVESTMSPVARHLTVPCCPVAFLHGVLKA